MTSKSQPSHAMMVTVGYAGAIIGFLLGFGFGVGCALAVMYSIYMGGYRAAVKDSVAETPPERLVKAREKALAARRS